MSLKEISCRCPKCGETYALGEALEEQAIEQVISELSSLNDEEINKRITEEKNAALEEGKKIAARKSLEQLEKKQDELNEKDSELNELKIAQVEKDGEISKLKQQQDAVISLKLAQEKSQWEADKTTAETSLRAQIQRLTEDLRKASERAEQGSMQAQGEASELAIEDTLKQMFQSDEVLEIKKGQRGADCLLIVKNAIGRPVGKILFESKDTKTFASEWVPKLKNDAMVANADISILVTTSWPADNNKMHLRDGVWVCGFHEYIVLVKALRQSLMDIAKISASEQAREGKAQVMFDFLTSQEFAHTIEQMISPIFRMHEQLQTEKRLLSRSWKERETLIETSISGTETLYMKIKGIAQVNLPSVEGLETIENYAGEDNGKNS